MFGKCKQKDFRAVNTSALLNHQVLHNQAQHAGITENTGLYRMYLQIALKHQAVAYCYFLIRSLVRSFSLKSMEEGRREKGPDAKNIRRWREGGSSVAASRGLPYLVWPINISFCRC